MSVKIPSYHQAKLSLKNRLCIGLGTGGVLLTFALLWYSDLAATGYYYSKLQSDLEVVLNDELKLASLSEQSNIHPLISTKDIPQRLVIESLFAVEKRNFEKALLLSSNSVYPATSYTDSLRTQLRSISNVLQHKSKTEKVLKDVLDRSETILKTYNRLSGEYCVALNIPLSLRKEASHTASLPLYKEGFLAGLPIIDGIPDNVADEKILNDHLAARVKALGGHIQYTPPDRSVLAVLDDIRSHLSVTSVQFDQYAEQTKYLEQKHSDLLQASLDSHQESKRLVREILREQAVPILPGRVQYAYNALRAVGNSFGQDMPELRLKTL